MMCSLFDLLIEAMEVGLLIAGIVALFRGKLSLTKNLATQGAPARLAGLILMLPFPVSIAPRIVAAELLSPPPQPPYRMDPGGVVAFVEWEKQKDALAAQLAVTNSAIILGVFAACVALAVIVVYAWRVTETPLVIEGGSPDEPAA